MKVEPEHIIDRVKSGDKEAFGTLVKQHQQYAYHLAFRLLCNEEDAKDVVQDSFVKIWRNIGQFNPQTKFTTWMFKIVTNTAIDKLRYNKRFETETLAGIQDNMGHLHDETPETLLHQNETGRLIKALTGKLPEKQQLVFVLRDLQGLTTEEVSEVLNMPATSIKSNLHFARKVIRKKLFQIHSYERSIK